jgi:Fur family ferric uptake transcriptional regulator
VRFFAETGEVDMLHPHPRVWGTERVRDRHGHRLREPRYVLALSPGETGAWQARVRAGLRRYHPHVATIDDWTDRAVDELEAGGKRSSVRRAVVEKLGAQTCAVSAADLDAQLRADGSAVGRATVYRVLERLRDLGLVERLDLGGAGVRYEPHRDGPAHHHHIVCDRCGEVVPFVDPGLERAIKKLEGRLDFAVSGHDVVLHGACGRCAA